eukprot:1160436-Pelagomonas_calceolata.AAC.21
MNIEWIFLSKEWSEDAGSPSVKVLTDGLDFCSRCDEKYNVCAECDKEKRRRLLKRHGGGSMWQTVIWAEWGPPSAWIECD